MGIALEPLCCASALCRSVSPCCLGCCDLRKVTTAMPLLRPGKGVCASTLATALPCRHLGPIAFTATFRLPLRCIAQVRPSLPGNGGLQPGDDGPALEPESPAKKKELIGACFSRGQWRSDMRIGDSMVYLGRYTSESDAARMYDAAYYLVGCTKPWFKGVKNFPGEYANMSLEQGRAQAEQRLRAVIIKGRSKTSTALQAVQEALTGAPKVVRQKSSQYKGVRRVRDRFAAEFTANRRQVRLGSFGKEEEAARAYAAACHLQDCAAGTVRAISVPFSEEFSSLGKQEGVAKAKAVLGPAATARVMEALEMI